MSNTTTTSPASTTPTLQDLADNLGVSTESLNALGVVRVNDAWKYPERDAQAEVTGHNRRYDDGTKKATQGSKRGLCFAPGDSRPLDPLAGSSPDAPVLIVEGMTDTAAGIDLDFDVVGRSMASPGQAEMAWLVELMANLHVVVMAENDASGAGKTGAEKTATALAGKAASVKIIYPPSDVKDLRVWVAEHGASKAELQAAIRGADVWMAQADDKPTQDGASDFPSLVPLDDAPAGPAIPVDALPDAMRGIVVASANFAEVSPSLAVVAALGVAATACQSSFEVELKPGYTEALSLFTAAIALPGERKSSQISATLPPLQKWEVDEADRVADENKASAAKGIALDVQAKQLGKQIEKATTDAERLELSQQLVELQEKKKGLTQKARQLFASDITPEALGILMANNGGSGAIITDEGGSFISGMAGRYARGDMSIDLPLQAWSVQPLRINRVGRDAILIAKPHLSIAVMIQPSLAAKMCQNEGFQSRGLLDRFLWLVPESKLGYRNGDGQPVPPATKQAWSDAIMALLRIPPAPDEEKPNASKPHTIKLSPDASRLWREYAAKVETYHRLESERHHLSQYCAKFPGQVARLAGVFHCLQHAHTGPQHQLISGSTMEQAICFGRVLLDHAAVAFGMMVQSQDNTLASRLWRWVGQHQHDNFTANQAWQSLKCSPLFPKAESVKIGLNVLVDRGYLRHERVLKSDHYTVNPATKNK